MCFLSRCSFLTNPCDMSLPQSPVTWITTSNQEALSRAQRSEIGPRWNLCCQKYHRPLGGKFWKNDKIGWEQWSIFSPKWQAEVDSSNHSTSFNSKSLSLKLQIKINKIHLKCPTSKSATLLLRNCIAPHKTNGTKHWCSNHGGLSSSMQQLSRNAPGFFGHGFLWVSLGF